MVLANTAPMASPEGEVVLDLACLLCGRAVSHWLPLAAALEVKRQGCPHCGGFIHAVDSQIQPSRVPLARLREQRSPRGRPPERIRVSKNDPCTDCETRLAKFGKPRCGPCGRARQGDVHERRALERQRVLEALRLGDLSGTQLAARIGEPLDRVRRIVTRERRHGAPIGRRGRLYHLEGS